MVLRRKEQLMRKKCDSCDNFADATDFKWYWLCAKCWLEKFAK